MTTPSAAAVAKALETTQHDHVAEAWPDTGWGRCTPGHLCGLCTAVARALDAYARQQAHWRCDLCHCCGEKRHDGGDPCVSCESTAREREAAVWEEAAKIADGFVETMTPAVAVDTGRMWRSGQATNIAAAIRARATGGRGSEQG